MQSISISSKEFIHRLKDLSINWNCKDFYFISADIDSLYTSVPVDLAILSILELLSEYKLDTFGLKYEHINTLLQLSLQDNYFKFDNTFYMQRNCLAMGNRLAVIAANCFVFKLERKLFSILPARPLFWIRYIDDVIARVQEHRDALKSVRSSAVADHSLYGRDTMWTGLTLKY